MNKDLTFNPNLFNPNGIVTRRTFFLNQLYCLMISSPIWIVFLVLCSIPRFVDNESIALFISFLFSFSITINTLLMMPSGIKRLRDIAPKINDKNYKFFIWGFLLLSILNFFNGIFFIAITAGFLYLLCKKGQISSKFPHQIENEFNWGACFGTWIWGIVNKSYTTLWMIPISITPLGTIFSIICGFKGNEWAIKNRDWENLEHFKESQNTQTIIFVILNILVTPILIFIISLALIFGFISTSITESIKNPEQTKTTKTLDKFEDMMIKTSSFYFESYEIKEDKNIFYVYPSAWTSSNFSDRKKMMDFAANISASQKNKQNNQNKSHYITKEEELTKTIFYNAKNKSEILAEYKMEKIIENNEQVKFKDYMRSTFKSYKFYEPKFN